MKSHEITRHFGEFYFRIASMNFWWVWRDLRIQVQRKLLKETRENSRKFEEFVWLIDLIPSAWSNNPDILQFISKFAKTSWDFSISFRDSSTRSSSCKFLAKRSEIPSQLKSDLDRFCFHSTSCVASIAMNSLSHGREKLKHFKVPSTRSKFINFQRSNLNLLLIQSVKSFDIGQICSAYCDFCGRSRWQTHLRLNFRTQHRSTEPRTVVFVS